MIRKLTWFMDVFYFYLRRLYRDVFDFIMVYPIKLCILEGM